MTVLLHLPTTIITIRTPSISILYIPDNRHPTLLPPSHAPLLLHCATSPLMGESQDYRTHSTHLACPVRGTSRRHGGGREGIGGWVRVL